MPYTDCCDSIRGPPASNHPEMTAEAFTIFIDGDCPLCRHEARLLSRLDRGRARLTLIDIAAPGFDPAAHGRTMAELMGTIHGRRPDGSLVTGMEVFRRAYAAVGWGWVLAPTGWPVLRPVFDRLYAWFAKRRLKLTGRGGEACDNGRCRIKPASPRSAA